MGYPPAKQRQTITSLIILLWLLLTLVPWSPQMPQTGLDPSWMHGINQALAQGLVFGKDIVFTLGPMASVFTQVYHPEVYPVTLAGSLLLALAYWGLLQQIWGRQPIWMGMLGLILGLIGQFDDAVLLFYPLLVALYGYQLARSGQPGWPGWILATAPLGLLALIKGTYLGLGLAVLLVWSLLFLVRQKPRLAWLGLLSPATTLLGTWLLIGQPPLHLLDYLQQMLVMGSGYTEAMVKPGPIWEVVVYTAGAGLGLLLWARQGCFSSNRAASWAVWLSFALFFFMAFRAGFARHDIHATIAAQALLLGGVVLFGLLTGRFRHVLLLFALLGAYSIENNHPQPGWGQILSVDNLRQRLGDLQQTMIQFSGQGIPLSEQYTRTMQEIARAAPLPQLDGLTDLYAYQQVHLLASGNTWNPRPTLQSHMAYSPVLAQLNRQHLLNAQGPNHLVFQVETIDKRLPSLDDGTSWPALLTNYRPTQLAGPWLVLRRQPGPPVLPRSVPISTETFRLGQTIRLPQQQGLLMARLDIQPSWLGNLANLAYRTAQLTITLELENGQVRQYRLIRGMAQAGFMLSPLVEDTSDFALLFDGDYQQIRQFTISTSALGSHLWQPTYRATLEYLDWQPPGLPTALQPLKISTPTALSLEPLQPCLGYLDQVNGKQPQLHLPNVDHRLKLSGWLALSTDPPRLPQEVIGVLIGPDGRVSRFDLQKVDRPDVASHFGQPSLRAAGFGAAMSTYHLPDGTYTLAVGVADTNTIRVCHQISTTIQIQKLR